MLDSIRRNSRSWFIYLIFIALIVVFALSFGPQAGSGCGTEKSYAVSVDGRDVSEASWRWAILMTGGGNASGARARQARLRETVMDMLILRELAAREAERQGFHVSIEEARRSVLEGEIYLLGQRINGKEAYYPVKEGETIGRFSLEALQNWVQYYGMGTIDRFVEEQQRELTAMKARDLLVAGLRVSPEEVRRRFDVQNDKVAIEYVRFDASMYRDAIEVTPADVDAYLTAKDKELRARYEGEKARFTGLSKELRLQVISVKKPDDATKEAAAKAKADAAARRVKAGEDFAAVARAVSEDEQSVKRGGDLGWRPANALRLGAEVADVAAKLQKDAVSDVIVAADGWYVIKLLGSREGDQSFDQVKRDLAEDALRSEKAKAQARAKADETLAAAKAGKALGELYPAPPADAPRKNEPRMEKGEGITRSGDFVPGIGPAPELIKALFDELKAGDVAGKVFEVGEDLYVIKLTARAKPDDAQFTKEKEQIEQYLVQDKASELVQSWMREMCIRARNAGEIELNEMFVQYDDRDDKGRPVQTPYTPCMILDPQN